MNDPLWRFIAETLANSENDPSIHEYARIRMCDILAQCIECHDESFDRKKFYELAQVIDYRAYPHTIN